MTELANAIKLEVSYQRECARERYLWLRRTSVKPLTLPTRDSFAFYWTP
jgi:hypothetical protein